MATATMKFVPNTAINNGLGSGDQHTITYWGTVTFSATGDTYATGGMAPLAGFAPLNLGPYGNRTPLAIYVEGQAGSGWEYKWNQVTGKLQVFSGTGGGATASATELTNGTALGSATPSIFADVVNFSATFARI